MINKYRWLKVIATIIVIIVGIILFFAVYNRIAISFEAKEITANGKLVEVGDYKIHVYAEGEKSDEPTLVFMSGSATVAPVYDFKILYSLLSDDYRIVVVEKLGYGYSDIVDTKRDVLSMVEETREALKLAGEEAPFVLLPHSMSGLEALYWAQNYPEEVKAVIGLDMAIPASMMR